MLNASKSFYLFCDVLYSVLCDVDFVVDIVFDYVCGFIIVCVYEC